MNVIRLSSQNPVLKRLYRDHHLTTNNSGFPTENYELSFDCPRCSDGARVMIKVGPHMDASQRIWGSNLLPAMDSWTVDWATYLSLTPSINYTSSGHGPNRPPCTFHGSIVNGVIIQ